MATRSPSNPKSKFIDKRWLREQLAEMDARSGFVVDPTVTAQQVREMMLAHGIRPEENMASRDIIRMREREEE